MKYRIPTSVNSARRQLGARYLYFLDHNLSPYWCARAPNVLKWLDPRPDDLVLEIGCGLGNWTSCLAPLVGQLYAIDISSKALQTALGRSSIRSSSPAHHPKMVCTSAEGLPFGQASFTKALAIDVIEHIPDDGAVLDEVYRTLQPGGRFVLTTLLEERPHYLWRMTFDDHIREYRTSSLVQLFKESGFQVQQVFNFYYAPRLISREIHRTAQRARLGHMAITKTLVGAFCRIIGDIEHIFPTGDPAGIGIVAVKPDEARNRP